MEKIKKEITAFRLILQAVPSGVTSVFVLTLFAMNLAANKSINLPFSWMALDGGFFFSWAVFLSMDMITRHFGPRAATRVSVFAMALNLCFSLVMWVVTLVPGVWGESFVDVGGETINAALDNTFGGTWYIIVGSSVAFLVSAVVNNYLNHFIGSRFDKNNGSFAVYALRTYVSTAVGQFVDNMVFALLVSRLFFGWSMTQCVVCAVTGMVAELLSEVIFSYWGYKASNRWKSEGVGERYFAAVREGAII